MTARVEGLRAGALLDLVIRRSTAADQPALERLAQLDSSTPPVGDHLLAEEDGELRAALPLVDGRAIADPFHFTAHLLAMLELRAGVLRAGAATPERGRGLRARLHGRRPERGAPPSRRGLVPRRPLLSEPAFRR